MNQIFPLLPLRDIVVFPGQVVSIFVGREKSVAALEFAMEGDKDIFLVAQLDPGCDDPSDDDLYDTGVVAQVLQLLKRAERAATWLRCGRKAHSWSLRSR
jgi:ATP-dependent Lon protease